VVKESKLERVIVLINAGAVPVPMRSALLRWRSISSRSQLPTGLWPLKPWANWPLPDKTHPFKFQLPETIPNWECKVLQIHLFTVILIL